MIMSKLQENARAMANGETPGAPESETSPAPPAAAPERLPEVNIPEPPPEGPEQVPVHIAWSRVMGDVRAVAKDERPETGAKFDYRGIDTALNVFGPVCRLHGVLVIPTSVDASYRDTRTSQNKPTRECTVVVAYRIYGPKGDHIDAAAAGESLDTGDKGSAKAQAVALRTLLFHGALVPTRDTDPDAHNLERGEAPVRSAASYRDEALDSGTGRERLRQIFYELQQNRMINASVQSETGDDEPIGELIKRVGMERFGGGQS